MRLYHLVIISLVVFLTALNIQASGVVQTTEYEPETVLVKFKPGASAETKANARASVGGKSVHSYKIVSDLEVVKIMGKRVPDAVRLLSKNPNILYAEPNYQVKAIATHPNDTYWGDLWGMLKIDAPTAWDTTKGNPNTIIAVIDTGVDYTHPDLAANIWTNPDEIAGNDLDDDENGYIDDIHGYDFLNYDSDPIDDDHYHGTHVAGTIGAAGDNNLGVVGVNWNCKIMALKFLGPDGGYTDDAIKALEYAVNKGAKLSNNSWGGGGYSTSLYDAITNAGASGHIFIAAAGNDSLDNDVSAHYPSSYDLDNIISVASIDSSDNLSSFSNYGLTSVDIAAPGSNILSTVPEHTGGFYGWLDGTSMATPHVTGAIALLLAKNPLLTTQELKSTILNSVTKLESLNGKVLTGGFLNISSAINSVESIADDTPPTFIIAPVDISTEATGVTTDVNLGTPTVTDDIDPNPIVTNDAPNGFIIGTTEFFVGTTTVTWTATDFSDNVAYATQTVTVNDTTVPTITAPADISVESSEQIAVDLGTPTVSDIADPNPNVTNDAPDLFPIDTTKVTWTATDASGNVATATQTVTVSEPAPTIPNAPTLQTAIVDGSNVTLNWADNSENETGFVVQRTEKYRGKYNFDNADTTISIPLEGENINSYADENVAQGTYKYRVYAYNDIGNSEYSNEVLVTVEESVPVDPTPTPEPGALEAPVLSYDKKSFELSWTCPEGACTLGETSKDGSDFTEVTEDTDEYETDNYIDQTTYKVTKVGTTYYKVQAVEEPNTVYSNIIAVRLR